MAQNKKAGFNNHGHNNNTKIAKSYCYVKSDAVKQLEKLANKVAQEKYPNIPSEWLAPRKYWDDSAVVLTKCIIDFIRFKGGQAEMISNAGGLKIEKMVFADVVGYNRNIINTHWMPSTSSNISATIQGRSVKIEVKCEGGKECGQQIQCQQDIEKAGGVYFIANSFDQFLNWYIDNFCSDVKPSICFE